MSKLLVVYATVDGQSKKIAEWIDSRARVLGWSVGLYDAETALHEHVDPSRYDSVLVIASVHAEKYKRSLRHWVKEQIDELERVPSAFISVCLGVLQRDPKVSAKLQRILDAFLDETGWNPTLSTMVAGAIPYTRYGWLKRWAMKRIAAKVGGGTDTTRDYDYTDWARLDRVVRRFLGLRSVQSLPLADPRKEVWPMRDSVRIRSSI